MILVANRPVDLRLVSKRWRLPPLVGILFATFVIAAGFAASDVAAQDAGSASIAELRGKTMGTTYSVKIVDPVDDVVILKALIETELLRVNRQMSTYIESSEISKFNRSRSLDWFDVSPEFAAVVSASLELSEISGGAFDVTIGPYIDLWNFGAARRGEMVPSDGEITQASERIGYRHLHVRAEPPAIRKDVAELAIDLSAIAKGHGVDRIVGVLSDVGYANVFVEIGGEVRVLGSKTGGVAGGRNQDNRNQNNRNHGGQGVDPWRVGIELPSLGDRTIMTAHSMSDDGPAMATSGDYRNYFEVDGKRYSHTIDPRTGRPVDHSLASVTVIAPTCMMADGWATALTVLGEERGFELAKQSDLHALLVSRATEGLEQKGTGMFAEYTKTIATSVLDGPNASGSINDPPNQPWSQSVASSSLSDVAGGATEPSFVSTVAPVFVVTALLLGAVLLAMAVGVIFGRHSISGSCGGIAGTENPDGSVSCSLCSNPADACKDLRERMKQENV